MIKTLNPTEEMRNRSGNIKINSKLVSFLYELIRDHLNPTDVEKIIRNSQNSECFYTNGWLAHYADDLAKRLQ